MSSIHKRGNVWWYYWRDDGVQRAMSLDTPDAVVAGIKKGEEDKKRLYGAEGLPFTDALWDTVKTDFLKGYQEGKTREGHEASLKLFERFALPVKISPISYLTAKGFRDHLQTVKNKQGKPYKPNSINIHLRNLHTFFNEAVKMKYVASNPFAEVKQIPVTKRAPRYFRKEDVAAIIEEAGRSWPKDKVLMLYFFLYTGVRMGELINLKWSALDLERGIFYLHGSEDWEPKDREEHAIALHGEILKRLKTHPKTSDFVFPGQKGGPRHDRSLRNLFNRLYKRAGKTGKEGLHILRHTFLTHAKIPLKAKQLIAGHSDIKTTMRYDHVTPEDLEMVKKISYR